MTDTQDRLRAGLTQLASHIEPDPPPVHAFTAPVPAASPKRRAVVAMIAAGILGLAGATAAATGTIPQPVHDVFERFAGGDDRYPVIPDDATLAATTQTPDGNTAEYWVADATDGGRCEFVRYTSPDGTHVRQAWSACTHAPDQGSGMPGLWLVASPSQNRTLAGHAPGGTNLLIVRFASGDTDRLRPQANGYFIAEYGDTSTDKRGPIQNVDAVAADGTTLDAAEYP